MKEQCEVDLIISNGLLSLPATTQEGEVSNGLLSHPATAQEGEVSNGLLSHLISGGPSFTVAGWESKPVSW